MRAKGAKIKQGEYFPVYSKKQTLQPAQVWLKLALWFRRRKWDLDEVKNVNG